LSMQVRRRQSFLPYLLILPMLLFALGFVYYPFLQTVLHSFSIVNARGEITGFAGLSQFRYLFSRREFGIAIRNTLQLTLINVPITLLLTLVFSYLCIRKRRLSPILEGLFALPMVVAMSSISLIFKVLLNPTVGYVNYALHLNIGWFEDRHTAMAGILLLTVWMGIGFNFLLFLSAFRDIDQDILFAAELEGAGRLRLLFSMQLPLMLPTFFYVLCTNMIQALMTNGPILILTQGGPSRSTTTLIYLMYTSGYASSNYSVAACVSLITFAMTFLFTAALFRSDRKAVTSE